MIKNNFTIPTEYTPYSKVVFCSNILLNVRYIINDNKFYPLLVGKSTIPKVWIYAKDKKNRSIELVAKSISKFPLISVNIDNDKKILSVVMSEKANKIVLLEINYISENSISIEKINLQPIGYNVTGDEQSLHVGNSNISRNTLNNVQSFIGLG